MASRFAAALALASVLFLASAHPTNFLALARRHPGWTHPTSFLALDTETEVDANETDDDDDDADAEPQKTELSYTIPAKKGPAKLEMSYTIPSKDNHDPKKVTSAAPEPQKTELSYTIPAKKGPAKIEMSYTIPSKDAGDDDDADDDDASDDDDDDDDAEPVHTAKQAKIEALEKDAKTLTEQLDINLRKQASAKAHLLVMADEQASDAEIEIGVKAIANQTDSKALASTLGKMWTEMREYGQPFYKEHLEGELERLHDEERQLNLRLEEKRASIITVRHEEAAPAPIAKAQPPPAIKNAARSGCAALAVLASTIALTTSRS